MTSIAEFEDFSFRYPHMDTDLIKDANFTIEQGTVTLLYGLSGSGKSTLCYALTGLIPWSVRGFFKGTVKLMGKSTVDLKPNQFAGEIGYLMQNPDSQFATLSVRDELVFAAENVQIEESVIKHRLNTIVKILDLHTYLDRNVTQLSSGEKQRVVLGSILMMKPELLILDEPLSFLDSPNRLRLIDYLQKVRINYPELTVIITEHRIHDISPLVDNYLEIKDGVVSQSVNLPDSPQKYTPLSNSSFSYKKMVEYYGFHKSLNTNVITGMEPILDFQNISFDYSQDHGNFVQNVVRVIQNISFKLYPHETISIVGPNGIGKTTLLYLIAGILQPTTGKILFHKQDISQLKYGKYSRNIGLIFQNPESQLLKNTIKKEIEFGPQNFKIPLSKQKVKDYTSFIFPTSEEDPANLLNLHPFNLSWGEKRRLNLASLYAYSPLIYLFDEPFTGQDFVIRKTLIENINDIGDKSGLTVISSHDEEILSECNRVFLLDPTGFTIYEKKPGDPF